MSEVQLYLDGGLCYLTLDIKVYHSTNPTSQMQKKGNATHCVSIGDYNLECEKME